MSSASSTFHRCRPCSTVLASTLSTHRHFRFLFISLAFFSGRCAERGERYRSRDRGNASRLYRPPRCKLPTFGMRSYRLMAGAVDIWKYAASICCSGFNLLQQRHEHLLRNNFPSRGTIKPKIELPISYPMCCGSWSEYS